MIIYTKVQSNLSISFQGEEFLSFCFWLPWQLKFCKELIQLSNFDRGPFKDYLCEVLSKLAYSFRGDVI